MISVPRWLLLALGALFSTYHVILGIYSLDVPRSPWPTVVLKSSVSTNVRVECGATTTTSPQCAAISGAPPAPGRRVVGAS